MVQLGLIRVLCGAGRDTSNEHLLSALGMASKVAVYSARNNEGERPSA